jgi:hypothetical protein
MIFGGKSAAAKTINSIWRTIIKKEATPDISIASF